MNTKAQTTLSENTPRETKICHGSKNTKRPYYQQSVFTVSLVSTMQKV